MDSPAQPAHERATGGRIYTVDDTLDGVAIGLRARWLLDAVSGLVGLLSPHGTVLELNGIGLTLSGLSRGAAAGRKLWELDGWYGTDAARRRTHRAVARAARDEIVAFELALPGLADEARTFSLVLTPIHDRRRQVTLLLLEGRDVTDLRTAEGELVRRNAELQALADQLGESDEQRRRFIADVSHELKTPMSITVGLMDRAVNDSVLPAPARRDIVEARRQVLSMQVQVDQLLTAARIEAGRLELQSIPCDLADLARRVAAGFESVASAHGVSMDVRTPSSVIVIADPQRVASAITNLLSNALKATPHGGRVGLELRERRRKARLDVTDTGPGVPERQRAAIFERFRQGDGRPIGGSGIGLALVNEIVTLHGGSVSIATAPEGGALFRLEFALAPPGSSAAVSPEISSVIRPLRERLSSELSRRVPARGEQSAEPDARPSIVLVEDNVEVGLALVNGLQGRYAIRHVTTAEHALQEIERQAPDALVTDIALPGMSGEELIESLRAGPEHDSMPIVAVSGEPDPVLGERLLRGGAQDFIAKPFAQAELAARIDGILARRAQALTASETAAFADASFDQAPLGVGVLESDGRWLRANHALCELLGYSETELRDLTLDDLTAPEDVGVEQSHLEDALAGRTRGFQVEKRLRRADGNCVWALLSVAVVHDDAHGPRLVLHVDDVTERRAADESLRRQVATDDLTGLLRRHDFELRLGRHLRRARSEGALLLVDIDRLVAINRRHGRAGGDRVLRAAARAIVASVPNGAVAGRIDGGCLAVFLGRTDHDDAVELGVALGDAVAGCHVNGRGSAIRLSAAVGGAMLAPGSSVDAAFATAEDALAAAKLAGGVAVGAAGRAPVSRGPRARATSDPRTAGRPSLGVLSRAAGAENRGG